MLIIDLDRFKAVNDGLGHETGDQLLNITGRRLSAMPGRRQIARLPGDQFAMLLDLVANAAAALSAAFAKSVRKALSAPIGLQDQEILLTASIGIASVHETGTAPKEGLRDAAVALYEAQRRGKDSAGTSFARQCAMIATSW